MTEPFKYWAFISYSHIDESWARWLHRALETYRVPRALVGRPSRDGGVPRRLFPVFRDREELPTSGSLSDNIGAALRSSRYLIVICSARAAVSRWVNEEVKSFKALGRADRVICLIVDGEPNASDVLDSGELECFPIAVRHRVSPTGEIEPGREEPIAADVRLGKDGKTNARLKILAGVLGVDFDALRQRERRRRIWRRITAATAAVGVALVVAGVWYRGHLDARRIEQTRDLRLADLMVQKAGDALTRGDDATAMFYGANVVRFSVLAGTAPLQPDLLASLSLSAVPAGSIAGARYGGALAVTPDGRRLAWSRTDNRFIVWDLSAGRVVAQWADKHLSVAVFSPDASTLAAATGTTGVVELRHIKDGLTEMLNLSREPVRTLAFDRNGSLLAAAGDDAVIRIWDTRARRVSHELHWHHDRVNAVAFSADGTLLASVSQDRLLALWKAASGKLLKQVQLDQVPRSVAFSPDGTELAVGMWDSGIRFWRIADWREDGRLLGHYRMVDALAFSPDGQTLATASDDWNVGLWDVSARDRIDMLTGHSRPVKSVVFALGGRLLLAGSEDGTITAWRIVPQQYYASFRAHKGSVRKLAFSPRGDFLVSVGEDARIRVWDWKNQRLAYEFPHFHTEPLRGLTFSPDGAFLATAGQDHRIALWDWNRRRLVASVYGHKDWIFDLAFSPDGRSLATAALDDTAKVWSVRLKPLATLAGHTAGVGGLAFSSNGRLIATASNDMTARLWDARTYKMLAVLKGHTELVRSILFTHDSQLLLTGGGDGRIKLWNVGGEAGAAYPREIASLLGHYAFMVWALAVSPDGRLLASGSQSNDRQTVRLWDLRTRRLVARLAGHRNFALSLAFSPDGKVLASGGSDGTIRLWRIADLVPSGRHEVAPNGLIAAFLSAPPYRLERANALVAAVGSDTGLELEGTDAQPRGAGASVAP
jgi:WD40 repeat protein